MTENICLLSFDITMKSEIRWFIWLIFNSCSENFCQTQNIQSAFKTIEHSNNIKCSHQRISERVNQLFVICTLNHFRLHWTKNCESEMEFTFSFNIPCFFNQNLTQKKNIYLKAITTYTFLPDNFNIYEWVFNLATYPLKLNDIKNIITY